MPTSPRDVFNFKFGRNAAQKPIHLGLIGKYVDALPEAPATFDHTNGFDGFTILGNGPDPTLTVNGGNPVGDCGVVMTANATRVDELETGEPSTYPVSNTVVSWYFTYTHGQDSGVVNAQLFSYWLKHPLPWAGKLAGWADVHHQDWDETFNAANAFGCLPLGIVVTEGMMNATQAGEPWDYTGTTADQNILGGHDTLLIARDIDGGELVTWGLRQKFTQRWFQNCVQEASALLTASQVERKGNGYGLDLALLEKDMTAIRAEGA